MTIDIVTPSLNQAAFLPETLASVRSAAELAPDVTLRHFVEDGGSTDGTLEVLKAQTFAQWHSAPDNGQSDAINRGLDRGSAEVVAYLCSDDILEPEAIREVEAVFEECPEADVVYGDCYFIEADSHWKRYKPSGPFSVERLRRHNFIPQPATFWKRSLHDNHGGFDASLQYCMDHEFWLRIAGGTQWEYIPRPLASMRLHPSAKTGSSLVRMWNESAAMQERYGLGRKGRREAWKMKIYGQYFYALKRRLFRRAGHLLLRGQ